MNKKEDKMHIIEKIVIIVGSILFLAVGMWFIDLITGGLHLFLS